MQGALEEAESALEQEENKVVRASLELQQIKQEVDRRLQVCQFFLSIDNLEWLITIDALKFEDQSLIPQLKLSLDNMTTIE